MSLPTFSNDEISSTPLSSITETEVLGAGDCILHKNFLSDGEAQKLFDEILTTIDFQQWYHMPDPRKPEDQLKPLKRIKRILVNPNSNGDLPYYRFTVNDQNSHGYISPIPAFLNELIQKINSTVNVELNHIVILLYRDGSDCIGFHKDKTVYFYETAPIFSFSLLL